MSTVVVFSSILGLYFFRSFHLSRAVFQQNIFIKLALSRFSLPSNIIYTRSSITPTPPLIIPKSSFVQELLHPSTPSLKIHNLISNPRVTVIPSSRSHHPIPQNLQHPLPHSPPPRLLILYLRLHGTHSICANLLDSSCQNGQSCRSCVRSCVRSCIRSCTWRDWLFRGIISANISAGTAPRFFN